MKDKQLITIHNKTIVNFTSNDVISSFCLVLLFYISLKADGSIFAIRLMLDLYTLK